MGDRGDIAPARVPAHRNPTHPERKLRIKSGKYCFRLGAAGRGIGDDPDPMPARRLAAREVDHVPEKPAQRRPQDMENIQSILGFPAAHRVHVSLTIRPDGGGHARAQWSDAMFSKAGPD